MSVDTYAYLTKTRLEEESLVLGSLPSRIEGLINSTGLNDNQVKRALSRLQRKGKTVYNRGTRIWSFRYASIPCSEALYLTTRGRLVTCDSLTVLAGCGKGAYLKAIHKGDPSWAGCEYQLVIMTPDREIPFSLSRSLVNESWRICNAPM